MVLRSAALVLPDEVPYGNAWPEANFVRVDSTAGIAPGFRLVHNISSIQQFSGTPNCSLSSTRPRGSSSMGNNLHVVRSVYSAFAVGDIPSVLATLSPAIEWTEAEGGPYGGVSVGPEAVLKNVFMRLGDEWDGFAAIAHEFVADGSTVVALGEYSGTYKATGKSFTAPFAHVWKLQGGKAISFHQYTDTAVHQRPLQA